MTVHSVETRIRCRVGALGDNVYGAAVDSSAATYRCLLRRDWQLWKTAFASAGPTLIGIALLCSTVMFLG
ncbi:MAG: hypothetical protein M3294_00575, partial [Pseudomonadota bacterium]|nr:hypothetical protein [Pseudomonadota bacterium]